MGWVRWAAQSTASRVTRSGKSSAKASATIPPYEAPTSDASAMPRSSSTAAMARGLIVGRDGAQQARIGSARRGSRSRRAAAETGRGRPLRQPRRATIPAVVVGRSVGARCRPAEIPPSTTVAGASAGPRTSYGSRTKCSPRWSNGSCMVVWSMCTGIWLTRAGVRAGRGGSGGDMPASWRVQRGGRGTARDYRQARRKAPWRRWSEGWPFEVSPSLDCPLIGLQRCRRPVSARRPRGAVVGGSSLRWTFALPSQELAPLWERQSPQVAPASTGLSLEPVSMSFSWSESKAQRVDVSRGWSRWRPHGVPMANGIHGVRGRRVRATSDLLPPDLRRRICAVSICTAEICRSVWRKPPIRMKLERCPARTHGIAPEHSPTPVSPMKLVRHAARLRAGPARRLRHRSGPLPAQNMQPGSANGGNGDAACRPRPPRPR